MTGMERKKLNSAATEREQPSRIAPRIVEPDLEVSEKYHGIYQKYKNIYPLVREFYSR